MDHETLTAIAAFFQDTTTALQDRFGLDPVERIIMLEVVAARLRTKHRRGPSMSTVSRGTGLPYETARRRVKKLIDRELLIETDTGLDIYDWETIGKFYTDLGNLMVKKLRPILERIESTQNP